MTRWNLRLRRSSALWGRVATPLLLSACLPGCNARTRDAASPAAAGPAATAESVESAKPVHQAAVADRPASAGDQPASERERTAIRPPSSRVVEHCAATPKVGRLRSTFWRRAASVDPAAWQAILRCPTLEILRVRAGQIPAQDLAGVCRLVHLRQLRLHDAAVSDSLLKDLVSSARKLEQLSLRNTPELTDQGVAEVAALTQLTHLALLEQQITGAATRSLAAMPQLQTLDLRMCHNLRAADLTVLVEAPQLRELKLGGYGVDDTVLSTVAQFPHLRSLTIEDASIGAQGLQQLAAGAAAAQIEELAFARCAGLTDDACHALGGFPRLSSLALRDVPVTGRFLQQLPHRAQLQRLALSQTYVTAEAFDALAACVQLQRLDLSRTFLNLDLTQRLARLQSLEYLDLSECGLDDSMIAPLIDMKQLKTLVVDGNPGLSPDVTAKIGAH